VSKLNQVKNLRFICKTLSNEVLFQTFYLKNKKNIDYKEMFTKAGNIDLEDDLIKNFNFSTESAIFDNFENIKLSENVKKQVSEYHQVPTELYFTLLITEISTYPFFYQKNEEERKNNKHILSSINNFLSRRLLKYPDGLLYQSKEVSTVGPIKVSLLIGDWLFEFNVFFFFLI
jgi:hypothetical protein